MSTVATNIIDSFPGVPECVVTPAQWFASWGKNKTLSPEQRLYFAVLEDALRSLARSKRTYECWEWIDGESDPKPYRITFCAVCEVLGIDADWLRTLIHRSRSKLIEIPRRSPSGDTKGRRGTPYQRLSGARRSAQKICAT